MQQSDVNGMSVFKINMNLLAGFAYALGAWLIWPDSLKWWGFGLMSICLGMLAPAFLIKRSF